MGASASAALLTGAGVIPVAVCIGPRAEGEGLAPASAAPAANQSPRCARCRAADDATAAGSGAAASAADAPPRSCRRLVVLLQRTLFGKKRNSLCDLGGGIKQPEDGEAARSILASDPTTDSALERLVLAVAGREGAEEVCGLVGPRGAVAPETVDAVQQLLSAAAAAAPASASAAGDDDDGADPKAALHAVEGCTEVRAAVREWIDHLLAARKAKVMWHASLGAACGYEALVVPVAAQDLSLPTAALRSPPPGLGGPKPRELVWIDAAELVAEFRRRRGQEEQEGAGDVQDANPLTWPFFSRLRALLDTGALPAHLEAAQAAATDGTLTAFLCAQNRRGKDGDGDDS